MIAISLLFYILFGYILINYILKFKKYGQGTLKGPTPVPLFGNILQIGLKPHEAFNNLHDKYGPVYRFWMGDLYTVVVNDVDILKKMYIDNSEIFLNHPDTPTNRYASNQYNDLAFAPPDLWREHRKLITNGLARNKLRNAYNSMDCKIERLLKSMKEYSKEGLPFEPHHHIQTTIMDILFGLIIHKQVKDYSDSKDFKHFTDCIAEVFEEMRKPAIGDYITLFKPFLLLWYKYKFTLFDKLIVFFEREFQQHRDTFKEEYRENPRDLLDSMISFYGEDQEKTLPMIYVCGELLLAGIETTSSAIEWSFIFLANYPDIQQKVFDEIQSIVGRDKSLKLSHRPSTPFLNAFIKELLRIRTVSPYAIPRSCTEDIIIDGHFIPKGAQILPNQYGASLNSKHWDNPFEFNPSRFLSPQNNGFNLFGYGPRSCPGQSIAMDEIYLMVGNIIKLFKISSVDGKLIDDNVFFGFTFVPNRFSVTLVERQ
ncbi:hypothetical protein CYY_007081 [Polysphondylium violaceum]|uniref:Cytochrome P450 family protein n=1 Tax=Polysphondylium violaceum TaxID=133409 RepID=A0A8J4UXW4_9MYCE|nr:hypothetical protein CYY_007081 [Polysphondylium violaceum]